jgi:hypothetical protein
LAGLSYRDTNPRRCMLQFSERLLSFFIFFYFGCCCCCCCQFINEKKEKKRRKRKRYIRKRAEGITTQKTNQALHPAHRRMMTDRYQSGVIED